MFLVYDTALTKIASLLPQVSSNPSIRIHLLSLDFSYSTIIRVLFEVLNKKYDIEEGEEGEIDSSSYRERLSLHCISQRMNLTIKWESPSLQLISIPHIHLFCRFVGPSDGLTFTVFPIYQTLVIADFVEVCLVDTCYLVPPDTLQTFVAIC